MTRDQAITFRLSGDELDELDRRKVAHGLSRTEYLIRAATGQLAPVSDVMDRVQSVESRLDRLERLAFND